MMLLDAELSPFFFEEKLNFHLTPAFNLVLQTK